MGNPKNNYKNGAARERRLVNKFKKQGFTICARSAGSHSLIDGFAIKREDKTIIFFQSKPRSMSENAKKKLAEELRWLNNEFMCEFKVL